MLINGFAETRWRLAIAAAAVPAVTAAGCGTAPSAPPTDGGPCGPDRTRFTVTVVVSGEG